MDDQIILNLFHENRERGFQVLVTTHAPFLERLITRLIHHPENREDCLQEILQAIFSSLPQFRGESTLKTWMGAIALRWARKLRATLPPVPLLGDRPHPEGDAPFVMKEKRRDIELALELLHPRDQLLLILFYFEGWSLRDLAEFLEVRENNVKIMLFRARKRFESAFLGEPHEH